MTLLRRTDHDAMYLNSVFSPRFSIVPLVLRWLGRIPRRPVILAPHGECSPEALKLGRAKKWAYLQLAQRAGLYRDVIWQASSEWEARDIHRCFGNDAEVRVAPNARCRAPEGLWRIPRPTKHPGALRMVFVSRIDRMKNLDGALRAMEGLRGDVELHIYGPREDPAYWNECRQRIARLTPNVRVIDHGPVPHEQVLAVMRQHHFFFLPTRGENFGFVILEALLAGCPVLISDRTPWRELAAKGVGWDLPLESPQRFRDVLQQCVDMDNETFQQMSRAALEYGLAAANDRQVLEMNRQLFALAGERRLAA